MIRDDDEPAAARAEKAANDAAGEAEAPSGRTDVDLSQIGTLPHTGFSRLVDRGVVAIGDAVSWLWLAIIAAIVVNVVYRRLLDNNIGQLEELQWHLYSAAFLVGIAYCVITDQHVRVDVLHARFRPGLKAWIELIGLVLLAIPFVVFVIYHAIPFVQVAWERNERSINPSGLPFYWIIKSVLLIAFVVLALAMLSRLSRVTCYLFGLPRPYRRPPD